jgi:hypothetical protein
VLDLQNRIADLTGKPHTIVVTTQFKNEGLTSSTYRNQVPQAARDAASGYANGLAAGAKGAAKSATAMAKSASDAVATFNESHSPSKLYHRHGEHAAEGLHKGLTSGKSSVSAAAKELAKEASKAAASALTALKVSTKTEIKGMLADTESLITTLKKKISDGQSRLSSLRSDRDNAGAAAKGVFTATGGLGLITGTRTVVNADGSTEVTHSDGTVTKTPPTVKKNWDGTTTAVATSDITAKVTAGEINAGLTTMRDKDRKFITDLKALKKLKLSQATLISILNMGPDAGDEYAQAILSGGQGEVNTINSLEGAIGQSGNDAAKIAQDPYKKSIDRQIVAIQEWTAQLKRDQTEYSKAKTLNINLTGLTTKEQIAVVVKAVEKDLGLKTNLKGRAG